MSAAKHTPGPGTHAHHYDLHPRMAGRAYCTVARCGLSIPLQVVGYAVEHGATATDALLRAAGRLL